MPSRSRIFIFRWLGSKVLGNEYAVSEAGDAQVLRPTEPDNQEKLPFPAVASDAPMCSECGGMMTRNGSCYKCENCGGTSGCSSAIPPFFLVWGGIRVFGPFRLFILRGIVHTSLCKFLLPRVR